MIEKLLKMKEINSKSHQPKKSSLKMGILQVLEIEINLLQAFPKLFKLS
jgi:hypothetical protein